jgi:hypothetical protein
MELGGDGMIRELLAEVGSINYDRTGNLSQPIFDVLRSIAGEVAKIAPGHYEVPISKGVGALPRGLWISILDPEVTTSPTQGTYVVLLFNEDRTRVSLSLNQGVTAVRAHARATNARPKEILRQEAARFRQLLDIDASDLEIGIELGAGELVTMYEAGNVYAKTWALRDLPSDEQIETELRRFLDIYVDAVSAKDDALQLGTSVLPPRDPQAVPKTRQREFRPKDDSDYRVRIQIVEQVRTRSHETLVARLGKWAIGRGFDPNTSEHPRDLILHRDEGPDCLVEVKVFPVGRPREGLRECIGQLFEYRHFFDTPDAPLIAALSEDPGAAYVELLTSLKIATVWPDGLHTWRGCDMARELGLVD